MAWAAMAAVPRVETLDWMASLPNWNMPFSTPEGMPMRRMFRISLPSGLTHRKLPMRMPPVLAGRGLRRKNRTDKAAAMRDSRVEIAAPATPRPKPQIRIALPMIFMILVRIVTVMGRRLLFWARNTEEPESNRAIKGKEREV